MKTVSCIIPAYNEAPRIGAVLEVVAPLIGDVLYEVIVIDDGSIDGTGEVVKQFSAVKLLTQNPNQGKSRAVARGIEEARGELILMLDADLMGLSKKNLLDLIRPVSDQEADISMSYVKNTPWPLRVIGLDQLSGQRAFSKQSVEVYLKQLATLPGFGIETFLNEVLIHQRCSIKVVYWPNVKAMYKFKKYGWRTGLTSDLKMFLAIIKMTSIINPGRQIIKMMRLRVN